jgi:hypothetical protein
MIYGYFSHQIASLLSDHPFQRCNISRYDATYATKPRYSGKISDTTCRDKGGASRAQSHLLIGGATDQFAPQGLHETLPENRA